MIKSAKPMMNKSKPKKRTTPRSPRTAWTIGGIAAAAGITVIILLAVFIWIPSAQQSQNQVSSATVLSFSSFADGTELTTTNPPVFTANGVANTLVPVINGIAVVQGIRPCANLVIRTMPSTVIGQSIEVNYLFVADKNTAIYLYSETGMTMCFIQLSPTNIVCGGGKPYAFSGLQQDDPVTLKITFDDTTSFSATITTSKFTGRSTGGYDISVSASTSISSLEFTGVYTATSSVIMWKFSSIKTTWPAFHVYA